VTVGLVVNAIVELTTAFTVVLPDCVAAEATIGETKTAKTAKKTPNL
jgi:hypothetical protein